MISRLSAFRRIAVTFIPLIAPALLFTSLIAPPLLFMPLIGPRVTPPPPGAPGKYRYSHRGNGRGARFHKRSAIHIFTPFFSLSIRRSNRPCAHTVYHCSKISGTIFHY
jgi:hypothetical protein